MKCLSLITGLGVFPGITLGSTPSAKSLIEGMEDTLWSDSNHGCFIMRIETEYWARKLNLEAWMVMLSKWRHPLQREPLKVHNHQR